MKLENCFSNGYVLPRSCDDESEVQDGLEALNLSSWESEEKDEDEVFKEETFNNDLVFEKVGDEVPNADGGIKLVTNVDEQVTRVDQEIKLNDLMARKEMCKVVMGVNADVKLLSSRAIPNGMSPKRSLDNGSEKFEHFPKRVSVSDSSPTLRDRAWTTGSRIIRPPNWLESLMKASKGSESVGKKKRRPRTLSMLSPAKNQPSVKNFLTPIRGGLNDHKNVNCDGGNEDRRIVRGGRRRKSMLASQAENDY